MDFRFYNPGDEIRQTANRLPHWQQSESVYYVTFRLADALPAHLISQLKSDREVWLKENPQPLSVDRETEYHRLFSTRVECHLDAGHGNCSLRDPACARIVGEALMHFDGGRYHQIAWIVMPNHAHTVFALAAGHALDNIILSWKTFTARRINASLGRKGPFWQRDYFDRMVRNTEHLANCIRYVRRNPGKARLRPGEYLLYESAYARQIA